MNPNETTEQKCLRYELTLKAIRDSKLTGVDFGDWVQQACEDVLEGLMPECPDCGTFAHEGPCVGESDDVEAARQDEADGPIGGPEVDRA
jgi:hypothetical protein